MKIKYVGTLPSGTLPDSVTGQVHHFKQGVPIEVRDELGEKLIKNQSLTWRKASGTKTKKKEGD